MQLTLHKTFWQEWGWAHILHRCFSGKVRYNILHKSRNILSKRCTLDISSKNRCCNCHLYSGKYGMSLCCMCTCIVLLCVCIISLFNHWLFWQVQFTLMTVSVATEFQSGWSSLVLLVSSKPSSTLASAALSMLPRGLETVMTIHPVPKPCLAAAVVLRVCCQVSCLFG